MPVRSYTLPVMYLPHTEKLSAQRSEFSSVFFFQISHQNIPLKLTLTCETTAYMHIAFTEVNTHFDFLSVVLNLDSTSSHVENPHRDRAQPPEPTQE